MLSCFESRFAGPRTPRCGSQIAKPYLISFYRSPSDDGLSPSWIYALSSSMSLSESLEGAGKVSLATAGELWFNVVFAGRSLPQVIFHNMKTVVHQTTLGRLTNGLEFGSYGTHLFPILFFSFQAHQFSLLRYTSLHMFLFLFLFMRYLGACLPLYQSVVLFGR